MKRLLILGFFVAGTLSVSAQIKQSIDVTLIEGPVVVSLANGEPIRGLTKENFTILQRADVVKLPRRS